MKVIPPLTITDACLTSSTAVEPSAGEIAWNAVTNYTLGTVVYRASTHRLYENTLAGVDATSPELAPTRWLDVGSTNKWAMFDTLRNTGTTQASPLTVVLTPGVRVNSVAVLNTNARSVTVEVSSGGLTVYTHTEDMSNRISHSWYEYYFGGFTTKPSMVLFSLPPYVNAVITVTQVNSSADITCGCVVIGNSVDIGGVEYDAISDALNFSTVERDTFGNATLIQRRNIPKTSQTLWLNKKYVNTVRGVRTALDAVPAVWVGLDNDTASDYFEALLILGIYRSFSINLAYPTKAKITLELEEV